MPTGAVVGLGKSVAAFRVPSVYRAYTLRILLNSKSLYKNLNERLGLCTKLPTFGISIQHRTDDRQTRTPLRRLLPCVYS